MSNEVKIVHIETSSTANFDYYEVLVNGEYVGYYTHHQYNEAHTIAPGLSLKSNLPDTICGTDVLTDTKDVFDDMLTKYLSGQLDQ